jgi:F-type H+-transporting ATPase subunit alpha
MTLNHNDFENILQDIKLGLPEDGGIVEYIGDGISHVTGFKEIMYGEIVVFEDGSQGIALDTNEEYTNVFLLNIFNSVKENAFVKRTHKTYFLKISDNLLGRIIDTEGNPLDNIPLIHENFKEYLVERPIRGIAERTPINKPLSTGLLTVDSLIPIGKGQRQLLIGNRSTGKSTMAINTIINQRNKNVICIYVAIGIRNTEIASIREKLIKNNALDYTIIISSHASESAINHYLAPYCGASIAEYFAEQQKDVLIVYDDLSNHAIAYREMCLLMKRAPGREAYPGDIFYLHARLLERAGNFLSGGSITALPIIQTQEDDLSAYVPTNLISITDGQIFFDTKLFLKNIKPAINTELSVSRVGGSAQSKLINKLSRGLRLDLAQYQELLSFSQFGGEIDENSQKNLTRGKILTKILEQEINTLYSISDEIIMLFLFKYFTNNIEILNKKEHGIIFLLSYIKINYLLIYKDLEFADQLNKELEEQLKKIIEEILELY